MPPQEVLRQTCSHNGCNKSATKSCAKCRSVFYCSRDCQKNHFKIHKRDCNKLDTARKTTLEARAEARKLFDEARSQHRLRGSSHTGNRQQESGFIREFEGDQETEAFVNGGHFNGQNSEQAVESAFSEVMARDNGRSGNLDRIPIAQVQQDEINNVDAAHPGDPVT